MTTVGGENISAGGEGLHEATGAEDYFYLIPLTTGQVGRSAWWLSLDGETRVTYYQDTLARPADELAVELNVTPTEEETGPGGRTSSKTVTSRIWRTLCTMTSSGSAAGDAVYSLRQGGKRKEVEYMRNSEKDM